MDERYRRLLDRLKAIGPAAVAFSGGVDSALLVAAARDAYGDQCLALTAVAPQMATWEISDSRDLCRSLGVRQRLIDLPLIPAIHDNPPERCYLCKRAIYAELGRAAAEEGLGQVLDGTNRDDLGDYRPGLKALREMKIASPLAECGLLKSDVRELSRQLGLPTWDKPAYACLLTRFPHDTLVTEGALRRVERAERHLIDQGFRSVRVRVHGSVARIELDSGDHARLLDQGRAVAGFFKALGFHHVAVDLLGYRRGSMNAPHGERAGANAPEGESCCDDAPPEIPDGRRGA